MYKRALLALSMVSAFALTTLPARNLGPEVNVTYSVSGTLGPVLKGSDPLKANGKAGTVKVVASASLSPTSHTATTATYKLPAGAVTGSAAGKTFKSSGAATMKISLGTSDTIFVSTPVTVNGLSATVTATVQLKKGSFTTSVLKHPTTFKPSPQTLTPAKTATGAGSKVSYSNSLVGTTILGASGHVTSN